MKTLENILEQLLFTINDTTGLSWAWSIIALTALVRIAILPLTITQTRSMMAMQRLQPYLKQVQQKYKDDKQEQNMRVMEFYRDNKVNPLASCFPMVLQLPVFFALFFVLKDFEKRIPKGASTDFSFLFGFIGDITIDIDKGGVSAIILLVAYVASQMFSSKVMMTTNDPRQKMLMMVLPVIFVPFIINFPIGLMLYWTTTNLWTLGQYVVIVRTTDPNKPVIMPEDSKGRKKEITPKAVKAEQRRREQADDSKASGSGSQGGGTARRNKRRR